MKAQVVVPLCNACHGKKMSIINGKPKAAIMHGVSDDPVEMLIFTPNSWAIASNPMTGNIGIFFEATENGDTLRVMLEASPEDARRIIEGIERSLTKLESQAKGPVN